jgi:poly-gamma-glutamate capsule biosynthesis protein CapA/YwtB (metallophosphatase superfamily)
MDRRDFLERTGGLLLGGMAAAAAPGASSGTGRMAQAMEQSGAGARDITLFLCGDVMTGRGIDQVLPHPGDPALHEPYAKSALDYVALAERVNGPIHRPAAFDYIWGDALTEWSRAAPDVRIVNLETSITSRDDWQRGKGIHYRMNPANTPCLKAAGIDCCELANNHVLDWGYAGLAETLESLHHNHIHTAGAGRDKAEASAPAILSIAGKGRVLVFSYGAASSGIPPDWAAGAGLPGVNLLPDLSEATLQKIAAQVKAAKHAGDVVVASIHWGGNWGYAIPAEHQRFAHGLIDQCGVDVVHGHSSHHPMGIEVYRERPIFYGCGDFLNDYEGIGGHEAYRGDLSLMYFLHVNPGSGKLLRLWMIPMQIRRFGLRRASAQDADWLRETLDHEGRRLGTEAEPAADDSLELRW